MAFRVFYLFIVFILFNSCAASLTYQLDLSDDILAQGGVKLVHLMGGSGVRGLSASFDGGGVVALEAEDGAWAVVVADLETEPGQYGLILKKGDSSIRADLEVVAGDYGTDHLRLPRRMVEFDGKTLERIEKEKETIGAVWMGSSRAPLWSGPFIMPVEGRVTGDFGTRRILNGNPRHPHGGLDIAAPAGTPVKAVNSGRVVFTGEFFFYGRFVIIDHGLGVFTLYAHLRGVDAAPGQVVEKGTVIGRVGSTGRATGPHLHFAVMAGGARVSPTPFFAIMERLMHLAPFEVSGAQTPGKAPGLTKLDYAVEGINAMARIPVDPLKIEQVFIPGGVARLGSGAEEKAYGYSIGGEGARRWRWFDSEVKRRVFVKDFYIDRYPVTQGQYLQFVRQTKHRYPFISEQDYLRQGFLVHPYNEALEYLWQEGKGWATPPPERLDDPVVLVSELDAAQYCRWRGGFYPDRAFRLPYENEWEKAARGVDGHYFPWGDLWDDSRANIARTGPRGTTPVYKYESGQSPYGVYDMAGNIFEWTLTGSGERGDRNILKSCSWDDMPGICRGAARHSRPKKSRHILIGFRCVSTAIER